MGCGDRRLLLTLRGHSITVDQVAFTEDGHRLLTGGSTAPPDSGTSVRQEAAMADRSGAADRISGVSFSPDGELRRAGPTPASRSGTSRRARIVALGHDLTIRRMVFSSDGTRLVGAAGSVGDDTEATVPVWDVHHGSW